MGVIHPQHPLRRFLAGFTEHTFLSELGVGDPRLVDYLSELLSRFLHTDAIYRLKSARGRPLAEVAEMVIEAQGLQPEGRTTREVHRHIGDFTLFWTGVYPEQVRRACSGTSRDQFIDYCETGKRSYFIASTFEDDQAPVLRRLSAEFELCAYGLTQVRREWEKSQPPPGTAGALLS